MRMTSSTHHQIMQRVKVGMIGLSAVILLVGLASAVFSAASRDRSLDASGASRTNVAAGPVIANAAAPDAKSEPLAELGIAPAAPSNAAEAVAQ